MTRLEDKLRRAIHAKADQVSSDTVPPLRLPARRRRSFSLAHGGGERMGAPAWRRWFAPAASAVLVLAVIAGSVAVSRLVLGGEAPGGTGAAAPANLAAARKAAAWVAAQVSRSAVVACDPAMCQLLEAHGLRSRQLDELWPGTASPLRSDVIVATPAVRGQFGGRLSSVYAPAAIASFGTGAARTDVRVTAPNGPAAYRSELAADVTARKAAGIELLGNPRIHASAAARKQLAAGQVDPRLMIVMVVMAVQRPITVVAFSDSGPGAGTHSPLRAANLVGTAGTDRSTFVQPMIALLQAQIAPYLPARARLTRLHSGQAALYIEYSAPSPLGLLGPSNP